MTLDEIKDILERANDDVDRVSPLTYREALNAAYKLLKEIKINPDDLGWIQCTSCGNGFEIHRLEVEAGDYVNRQTCDECGIGPMLIDWTYPNGPGWVAEKK